MSSQAVQARASSPWRMPSSGWSRHGCASAAVSVVRGNQVGLRAKGVRGSAARSAGPAKAGPERPPAAEIWRAVLAEQPRLQTE